MIWALIALLLVNQIAPNVHDFKMNILKMKTTLEGANGHISDEVFWRLITDRKSYYWPKRLPVKDNPIYSSYWLVIFFFKLFFCKSSILKRRSSTYNKKKNL